MREARLAADWTSDCAFESRDANWGTPWRENLKINYGITTMIDANGVKYNNDIENLKEKLVTYQTNSSHLKSDLRVIKNRYIEIESKTRCEACSVPIFNMEFYLFQCMKAVHK